MIGEGRNNKKVSINKVLLQNLIYTYTLMHNILFDIHITFIREHLIFLRQNVGKENRTNKALYLKSIIILCSLIVLVT